MSVIVNYPIPSNVTINITPTNEVVVNVLQATPIVVNLCNEQGTTTTDYTALTNKPKINNIELIGNKTSAQLGLEPAKSDNDNYVTDAEKAALHSHENKSVLDGITSTLIGYCNAAYSWVSTNGANVLTHISDSSIHVTSTLLNTINNKVDKVTGKGLSTNDFTDDYKTTGLIGTGVVNPSPIGAKDISTVKKLADAFDETSTCLLRTVSVPTNTTSVVINTTDTGVSFSSLDINQIGISVSGILVSDVVTSCFIGVNALYAEPISNYYQTSTSAQPSGFLSIIRKFFTIHGIITAEGNDASGFFSNWRATALNPLSNVVSSVSGIAKFGNVGGKITEVRIIVSGANFDAGTTIKITKLC